MEKSSSLQNDFECACFRECVVPGNSTDFFITVSWVRCAGKQYRFFYHRNSL